MKRTGAEYVLRSMKRRLAPVADEFICETSYCASKADVKRWIRALEGPGKAKPKQRKK